MAGLVNALTWTLGVLIPHGPGPFHTSDAKRSLGDSACELLGALLTQMFHCIENPLAESPKVILSFRGYVFLQIFRVRPHEKRLLNLIQQRFNSGDPAQRQAPGLADGRVFRFCSTGENPVAKPTQALLPEFIVLSPEGSDSAMKLHAQGLVSG